jgi:uncharacterized Rmd1/YagE family protein
MLSSDTITFATDKITVRALYIAERIDIRSLELSERYGDSPLVIPAGANGCAILFRYGVVVLFGLQPLEEVNFIKGLESFLHQSLEKNESETVELRIHDTGGENVNNNIITLREATVPRLQIVAEVLSKSVVLAHYEATVAAAFDSIDPFARGLKNENFSQQHHKPLLRYVGDTLLIQHKMVGRVEVTEKPDVLWDHPELNRLFQRLEDEYEIVERHNSIEHKLSLIARTVETALDVVETNRSNRLEWYIVILICIEIVISLFEIVTRK